MGMQLFFDDLKTCEVKLSICLGYDIGTCHNYQEFVSIDNWGPYTYLSRKA
jgi:hypothetical protein